MYSRFSPERREKISLPEHYSGCAFSTEHPYPPAPQAPPKQLEEHMEQTDRFIQKAEQETARAPAEMG